MGGVQEGGWVHARVRAARLHGCAHPSRASHAALLQRWQPKGSRVCDVSAQLGSHRCSIKQGWSCWHSWCKASQKPSLCKRARPLRCTHPPTHDCAINLFARNPNERNAGRTSRLHARICLRHPHPVRAWIHAQAIICGSFAPPQGQHCHKNGVIARPSLPLPRWCTVGRSSPPALGSELAVQSSTNQSTKSTGFFKWVSASAAPPTPHTIVDACCTQRGAHCAVRGACA